MRLALQLHKSRAEILRLSSEEITWWKSYFQIYPFEDERADFRSGMIAMLIHNAWAKSKKKLTDFLPKFQLAQLLPSTKALNKKLKGFSSFLKLMKGTKNGKADRLSHLSNQSKDGTRSIQ